MYIVEITYDFFGEKRIYKTRRDYLDNARKLMREIGMNGLDMTDSYIPASKIIWVQIYTRE